MSKETTKKEVQSKLTTLQPDQWLTLIKEKGLTDTVYNSYTDVGILIDNLIGVCATALESIGENPQLSPYEQQKVLGSTTPDVANVLRFTQSLLPVSEFEYLTKIQDNERL